MKRCVVIGGGITGMSGAVLLAKEGVEVTLVEKSPHLAPLLRGFNRKGIHFETGFHFAGGLGASGLLTAWLKTMGLELPYEHIITETETVCISGRRYVIPCGREALLDWTRHYFPASLSGMEQFLNELTAKFEESPYTSPWQTNMKPLFSFKQPETVTEHLNGLPLDEDLKSILKARCLLYGASPAEALWSDYALVAGTYFFSSSTFTGGGETFIRAWEEKLLNCGVHMRCGKPVTHILLKEHGGKKNVCGIELEDGERLFADGLLFTGNPVQLPQILPRASLRPAFFHHIESMKETPDPFVVYGIADDTIPELHCWYKAPGDEPFRPADENDPSLCVMTGQSQPDGRKSCLIIGLHKPTVCFDDEGSNAESYSREKERLKQGLADEAESMLPELTGHWQIVEASTAKTMRSWIYGSTGSIYGFLHAKNTLPLSPVTKISGLLLAGQNILLPGMLGCIISAAIASELMLGEGRILDRFRACAKEGS